MIAFARSSGRLPIWGYAMFLGPLFAAIIIADLLFNRSFGAGPTLLSGGPVVVPRVVGVFIAGLSVIVIFGGTAWLIVVGLRIVRRAASMPRSSMMQYALIPRRVACGVGEKRLPVLAAVEPTFFEPLIVNVGIGLRPSRAAAKTLLVVAVAAGLLSGWLAGVVGLVSWPSDLYVNIFVVAGYVAALAAAKVLFPAHLRISPGRLEVIRSGVITRRPRVVQSIDLTRAIVRVDDPFFLYASLDGREVEATLLLVPNRREVCEYMLRAAIADAQGPAPPADAFTA